MKIANYTPHEVVVYNPPPDGECAVIDDSTCHLYLPSGLQAQVAILPEPQEPLEDGCPTCTIQYGDASLPPGHEPDAYAIVSTMFADAYRRQNGYDSIQLLVPDFGPSATRKDGQVVSVRRLIRR
jgi:hypothetical protein